MDAESARAGRGKRTHPFSSWWRAVSGFVDGERGICSIPERKSEPHLRRATILAVLRGRGYTEEICLKLSLKLGVNLCMGRGRARPCIKTDPDLAIDDIDDVHPVVAEPVHIVGVDAHGRRLCRADPRRAGYNRMHRHMHRCFACARVRHHHGRSRRVRRPREGGRQKLKKCKIPPLRTSYRLPQHPQQPFPHFLLRELARAEPNVTLAERNVVSVDEPRCLSDDAKKVLWYKICTSRKRFFTRRGLGHGTKSSARKIYTSSSWIRTPLETASPFSTTFSTVRPKSVASSSG